MNKSLILIEDNQDAASSIELVFKSKGFNVIHVDSSEITREEIQEKVESLSREVLIISDYNDDIGGGTFSKTAAEFIKELRNKGLDFFFVANSANTNEKLVEEIGAELGESFTADYSEPLKNARNILEQFQKRGGEVSKILK